MKRLRSASLIRRVVGLGLLRASVAYVMAQRVVEGLDLKYACTERPVGAFLKALILTWVLTPLHLLSKLLVHKPILAALGIQRLAVSGGGSLVSHLDLFYEAIGLTVLNGWGLTETSPVLCCRLPFKNLNVRGTVGMPLNGTEIKIVDPESMEELSDGTPGLIFARGPGVMQGYHKDPEETAHVMSVDNWFSTGDRGWRVPSGVRGSRMAGNIVLTGRVKDTIVLSSGENVEPQPIEDWLQVSHLISHIMVIGQDHRSLGALVVPDEDLSRHQDKRSLQNQILHEIHRLEHQNPNFVHTMHVSAIQILDQPFSVENGTLTKTMKIRRGVVRQQFAQDVASLLKRLR